MGLMTCSYCGMEYSDKMDVCPRCGRVNSEITQQMPRGSAAKNRKSEMVDDSRIPRWMWIVSCIVLAVAVLIGIGAFVIQMGFLDGTFTLEGPSTELPELSEPAGEELDREEDVPPEEDDRACVDLSLNHEEFVFTSADERVFLSAVTRPADCKDEIEYESTDEEIVTVSEDGMITVVAPGEAEIIVTCGEVTKICRVRCDFEPSDEEDSEEENEEDEEDVPVAAPEVAPDDFTLFYPGEVAQLRVSNVPEGTAVTYSSSNSAVAEVSASGQVTAKANGQAIITITIGDVTLTSTARCNFESSAEAG